MPHAVIHLHPSAPPKPAEGAACNGCGVCCAWQPCPLGVLASAALLRAQRPGSRLPQRPDRRHPRPASAASASAPAPVHLDPMTKE